MIKTFQRLTIDLWKPIMVIASYHNLIKTAPLVFPKERRTSILIYEKIFAVLYEFVKTNEKFIRAYVQFISYK